MGAGRTFYCPHCGNWVREGEGLSFSVVTCTNQFRCRQGGGTKMVVAEPNDLDKERGSGE